MAEEEAYTCAKCGGPNPAYALNCQWCGAALEQHPLPPASSTATIPFETPSEPLDSDELDPSPWGNRTSIGIRIAAVVIIFVVVAVVALSASSQSAQTSTGTPLPSGPSYAVNVTVVELRSSDNACGLNGTTERGWTGVTSAASGQTWQVTAPSGGCTISDVSAITGGFEAFLNSVGGQAIPGGETEGVGVSYLMIGLGGPYTGPLILSVT